ERSSPVLTSFMLRQVLWRGGLLLLFCLCFLGLPVFYLPRGQNSGVHLGSFFALFVYCGILLAFGVRTSCINPLKNLGQNMTFVFIMGGAALVQTALSLWGGTLFRSGTLSPYDLGKGALLSMLILPADMLIKLILNATKKTRK
ncbi:MAG: cation transporting ATPase C-terminal domain-containing protein, partial [Oscillospiraceae bacterium]|nr:cation transporting ATPase C-terminal domain-containing protein [Oscillospiraceae bacterium]